MKTKLPQLAVLGGLLNAPVSTSLHENIRTDEAIGTVLDAMNWPKGKRRIQHGRVRLSYWFADNANAFESLAELCAAEGPMARICEDADGNIVFKRIRKTVQD